jgi:PAS domain S-box-containing protein
VCIAPGNGISCGGILSKIRNDDVSLRAEAEEQLFCAFPAVAPPRSAEELLHELQVHQVELQMQNEELRRAQNALEESRDRYLDLYDFAPIGYLTLNNNSVIDDINLTAAALLGMERNKLVHQRFAPLVTSEYSDFWHQHFMRAKLHDGKYSFELVLKRGEQSVFYARMDCMRLDTLVRVILTDISEQKRMEKEALERRTEMAELHTLHVAAQTTVAIAHELNQPLLAIATYSEAALMLMNAENPDVDKIRRALNGCERQALRAGQSIRELLGFLCAHKFESEVFELNACVHEVLDVARAEHELHFESILRLEEGMPYVRSNRSHVKKVLFNLLHNGIEAMQEAGIPLPTVTVTVSTRNDGNVAQVTISDNGPGIGAEHAHRLFEPFFTTKPKGIGMGLAISRSLIEENGGQLWVDPQGGHGATFHLTLPFAT